MDATRYLDIDFVLQSHTVPKILSAFSMNYLKKKSSVSQKYPSLNDQSQHNLFATLSFSMLLDVLSHTAGLHYTSEKQNYWIGLTKSGCKYVNVRLDEMFYTCSAEKRSLSQDNSPTKQP